MAIEFTQHLLPRGEHRTITIDRSCHVETMARRFTDSGGRFECEVLRDLETVSLTAVHNLDGQDDDVAVVLCKNGPEVPLAVDELVRKAVGYVEKHSVRGL